ncbi:MAG: hypothetical protein ABSF94_02190 [Steroidobacteraceae bacterium]
MTSTFRAIVRIPNQLRTLRDLILFQQTKELQAAHPNPLNKFGRKCFSQSDEDGITLEILRRIGVLTGGVYAEFGVGNGTENNSLVLAAMGWRGFWVGGESLCFDYKRISGKKFAYIKDWITRENIVALANRGLTMIGAKALDVISLDLDGNDIYLAETLLSQNLRPKLFIVEYNAKFPPPIEFKIAYDAKHLWQGDDYFGASLSSYDRLFKKFGYRLVCCNSQSGANAFFIDKEFEQHFTEVPVDVNDIYVEPRYHEYQKYGFNRSIKTIERLFDDA